MRGSLRGICENLSSKQLDIVSLSLSRFTHLRADFSGLADFSLFFQTNGPVIINFMDVPRHSWLNFWLFKREHKDLRYGSIDRIKTLLNPFVRFAHRYCYLSWTSCGWIRTYGIDARRFFFFFFFYSKHGWFVTSCNFFLSFFFFSSFFEFRWNYALRLSNIW